MDARKYMRLKQPATISDLRYDDSFLLIKDVTGSVLPMDTFVLMCRALCDSKQKKAYAKQVYDAGKYQSRQMLLQLVGDDVLLLAAQNLGLLLQPVRMSGFGDISIVRFDIRGHNLMFKVRSTFGEQYKKLFSLNKDPVDLFLAGMIAGSLSYLFKKDFAVRETSCVVQGKEFCTFEADILK
ncbi:MAG: 4-vinyl reductase [Nanoarchaeota archaeon]|nr:4-vinyl reductase [Nanoarchaeota archaeon]